MSRQMLMLFHGHLFHHSHPIRHIVHVVGNLLAYSNHTPTHSTSGPLDTIATVILSGFAVLAIASVAVVAMVGVVAIVTMRLLLQRNSGMTKEK